MQIEPLLEAAAEAGATGIGGIALHLRGEVKQLFFDWLRAYRPDLLEHYEQLYARGAYAPQEEGSREVSYGKPGLGGGGVFWRVEGAVGAAVV